jgi:hypothetical protein
MFTGGNALESKYKDTNSFTTKRPNIHQSRNLAKGVRERMEDIHGGDDPFWKSIVDTLESIERGIVFSKYREDGLGRITGLKTEKKRMRG